VPEAFTVPAGKYKYFGTTISTRSECAQIAGRFHAEGGSGNDIEVFILDGDQFENWRNGHSTPTYYNSGRVTVGKINVCLPSGTYNIIFSNTFSSVSNKAITADIIGQ
jgi:hypothetical protein